MGWGWRWDEHYSTSHQSALHFFDEAVAPWYCFAFLGALVGSFCVFKVEAVFCCAEDCFGGHGEVVVSSWRDLDCVLLSAGSISLFLLMFNLPSLFENRVSTMIATQRQEVQSK